MSIIGKNKTGVDDVIKHIDSLSLDDIITRKFFFKHGQKSGKFGLCFGLCGGSCLSPNSPVFTRNNNHEIIPIRHDEIEKRAYPIAMALPNLRYVPKKLMDHIVGCAYGKYSHYHNDIRLFGTWHDPSNNIMITYALFKQIASIKFTEKRTIGNAIAIKIIKYLGVNEQENNKSKTDQQNLESKEDDTLDEQIDNKNKILVDTLKGIVLFFHIGVGRQTTWCLSSICEIRFNGLDNGGLSSSSISR